MATTLDRTYIRTINPIHQTRSFLAECLSEYRTASSKKAFLTREVNSLGEFIIELKRMAGDKPTFWYLGEVYTKGMIKHYEDELNMVLELRKTIN